MISRVVLLLVMFALPGCAWPGARFRYDPKTNEVEFERGWLSGPFYADIEVETPEGLKIRANIQTDPDVTGAIQDNAQRSALVGTITEAAVRAAITKDPIP